MREEATVGSVVDAPAGAGGPGALLELKERHGFACSRHFYRRPPQIVRGVGATLYDHEGRAYVDCLSGVGVMNAGHCNSAIIEPAIEQIRSLQHTTSIYLTEPALRLAAALAELAAPLSRVFFCASGSEAVEYATLLAMVRTGRRKIVAFESSLHGRTRWSMNLTGLPRWRGDPFPSADVLRVPFGDERALARTLGAHGGEVAAVVGEPVQGNGGIVVPREGFWKRARALCDEHGALLVLDEVQTGFNRTGSWFACERFGVVPDVMAISKGLGNGFPIAAVLATESVAAAAKRPSASTHGGNPVSAAAALATIEYHRSQNLGERAERMGAVLGAALRSIAGDHGSLFGAPRGLGLMWGLPLGVHDGAARCDEVLERLKDRGVLAGKAGPERDVIVFMPPLVITEAEIEQVAEALHASATCTECVP